MSISLSYDDTLSRVQIGLSGLPDGTVRVERSTNQLLWETVRGGTALPVSGGEANLDDFEFAADVENHYRIVPVDPPAGLLLPGSSGAYASTPDRAAFHTTEHVGGDFVVTVDAIHPTWDPDGEENLASQFDSDNDERAWRLGLMPGGFIRFVWTTDGTLGTATFYETDVPVPAGPGDRLAVSVWLNVEDDGDHSVHVYAATEANGTNIGSRFDMNVFTGEGTTTVFDADAPLEVGSRDVGSAGSFGGTILRMMLWDGNVFSGGDLGEGEFVADVDFTEQKTGVTSFDDDTGLTWTVHGDAEIVGDPVHEDSITPDLEGRVWLKSIRYPLLNRTIDVGNWGEISRRSRTGIFDVAGRSYPVSTHDLRGSRQFTLTVWTDDMREDDTTDPSVDARKLDLILALSDVMFIHVPADSPVPGGYVAIEDVAEDRIVRAGNVPREFNLACVEVAPPSPLVVGTTLTWGTVWAQYASWTQLWAANPSWRDLLATVGSGEDLVTL